MKKYIYWAILIALISIVACYYIGGWSSLSRLWQSENNLPIFIQSICRPETSSTSSYNLSVQTDIKFSAAALLGQASSNSPMQNAFNKLEGILSLIVIESTPTYSSLQGRLAHDTKVDYFQFKLQKDCTISEPQFSPDIERKQRIALSNILSLLSFKLSNYLSVNKWETSENDSIGNYSAHYRILESSKQKVILEKTKLRYDTVKQPPQGAKLTAELESSEALITLREGMPWISEIAISEKLVLKTKNQIFTQASLELQLSQQQASTNDFSPFDTESFEEFHQQALGEKTQSDSTNYESSYPVEKVQGKSLQEILTSFDSKLDEQAPGGKRKAVDLLVQYLSTKPEAAGELVDVIKKEELPANKHSLAFLALELSTTQEAQDALRQVLTSEEHSPMNRMRAAIALQDAANPSQESIDSLINTMHDLKKGSLNESEQDVARTAALSLGTLISKQWEKNPQIAQESEAKLVKELHSSNNTDTTSVLLESLGNTLDPTLETEVQQYLQDNSEQIRSAAVSAIGALQGPESSTLLTEQFKVEESPTVRRNILKSLSKLEQPSPNVIKLISDSLSSEPLADTRTEMIKFIGPHAKPNSESRKALLKLLETEENTANVRLIGRYLKK